MARLGAHERSDVDKEACAWIAQFDGAEPTAADLEAFREWINRSPRHREAMERLSSLWGEMNVLTELAVPPRAFTATRRRSWAWPVALAASLLCFVAVLLAFRAGEDPAPALYATAVGEQRDVLLPDGTQVKLNTATQLRVAYTDRVREVYLLDGEAYFDVAREPERPFRVQVDERTVSALGTAFSVRRDGGALEVLVTEGIVELAERVRGPLALGSGRRSLGTVKRGQRVRLAEVLEAAEAVSEEEVARELAWREGMLSFAGEPLALVVAEIGRYDDTRIVIEDKGLRELRVGGYFRAGDTDALLATLEAGFPIEVVRGADGNVRLRRRQ